MRLSMFLKAQLIGVVALVSMSYGALAASGLSVKPGPYVINLPSKNFAFTVSNNSKEFIAANIDFQEIAKPNYFGPDLDVVSGAKAPIVASPRTIQVGPGETRTVRIQWRSKEITPPKYYHMLVTQSVVDSEGRRLKVGTNYKIPVYVELANAHPEFFIQQSQVGNKVRLSILNTGKAHDYLGAYALQDRTVVKLNQPLLPGHQYVVDLDTSGREVIAVFTKFKKWFGVPK